MTASTRGAIIAVSAIVLFLLAALIVFLVVANTPTDMQGGTTEIPVPSMSP